MQTNTPHTMSSNELHFHPSPRVTLGVELELQVIDQDPDNGDLAPGAIRILDACEEDGLTGVDGEFLLSMVEIKTGICADVEDVKQSLTPLLRRVRNIARGVGYELALGGTHPFSLAVRNAVSPGERYDRMRKRQGGLAYQEAFFGLHVHVGVPGGDRAIGLMNELVPYLPHLLGLSANSPFWQGVDTEFASSRAMLFRPGAHAGIPMYSRDWEDYCHYYNVMRTSGIYESPKDLYWDLRPRPDLGTLEFRICDAPASLAMVLAITALIRYLVVDRLEKLRPAPTGRMRGPESFWLAAENKYLAARYGLGAKCLLMPDGERRSLEEQLITLLQTILPAARRADEEHFLEPLLNMTKNDTGAERLRMLYRQTGKWQDVISEMKNRWADELEEADIPALGASNG